MTEPSPEVRTGVPLVDSILVSVEAAAHLPVDEQVGVFERAHEQLRRALDAPTGAAEGEPGPHLGEQPA